MHMRTCLIPNDGYTEQGFIAEVPGIHGEVRFTFRPMRCEVRSRVMEGLKEKKAAEQDAIVAKYLVEHIVRWDVEDDRGKPVALKIDTFRRLKPKLFYRLWDIVLGFDATDLDPAWGDDAMADHVDDLMEAAGSPEPIGAACESRDAKNSEPA